MSFDDDMKNRFQNQAPTVTNVDAGAAAAATSAGRRTAATRGLAAIAFFLFVGVGALALTPGGDNTSLDVADDPTADGIETPAEDPEQTSQDSDEVAQAEEDSATTTVAPPEGDEVVTTEPDAEPPTGAEPANDPEVTTETTIPEDEPDPVSTLGTDVVFQVVNVDSNDTLNARQGPGTSFDVVFELAPTTNGVVRTETDTEFVGTSEWVEVYSPAAGSQPGWVNSSFLEPAAVSNSSPCIFNGSGSTSAGSWTNTGGSANSDAVIMSIVDSYRFGSCIRTVIQGFDGFSSSNDPASPATSLPNDITVTGNSVDGISLISFGPSIMGSEIAQAQFVDAFSSQSTYIFRSESGVISGFVFGASSTLDVQFDNATGTMIIDVADTQAATAGAAPLFIEDGVVVTDVFAVPNDDGTTSITVSGFARPFEAVLGVEILDGNTPVPVEWTGAFNTGTASSNGVSTTDWSSAWGAFDFTIDIGPGINPFDLTVRVDPSGGASDTPIMIDLTLEDLLN